MASASYVSTHGTCCLACRNTYSTKCRPKPRYSDAPFFHSVTCAATVQHVSRQLYRPTRLHHKVMLMVSCLGVLLPPSSGAASPTRGGGADHPRGGDGGSGGGMWRDDVARRTGRTGSDSTGTSSHSGSASRKSTGDRSRRRRLGGVRDRRSSLEGPAPIDTCLPASGHSSLVGARLAGCGARPPSSRRFLCTPFASLCARAHAPSWSCSSSSALLHLVKELIRETGD